MHPLKWFHIQVLDLNIPIQLHFCKATLHPGLLFRKNLTTVNSRLLPVHPGHFACQIVSLKRAFSWGFHVSYFCQVAPAYPDGGKVTVVVKFLVHAQTPVCETLCKLMVKDTGSLYGMLGVEVSFYAALHFWHSFDHKIYLFRTD